MLGNIIKGFEKQAGLKTEAASTLLSPTSLVTLPAGAIIGPYSKEQQEAADARTISNLLPGVGGYRLGRRAATMDALNKVQRDKADKKRKKAKK